MKYLDNPGLPAPLYSLLTSDVKARRAKFSVTELLLSPQMLQLRRRHDDEIVLDPLDNLWRLFGKLCHGKLEAHAGVNALVEEGLTLGVYDNGMIELISKTTEPSRSFVTVSATPDLYEDETVTDYKFTSVWSVKDGIKDDWERQLNLYMLFFLLYGFSVKHLRIVAIARDWSAAAAKRDKDYPPRVKVFKVKLWSKPECELFLRERVRLHEAAEKLPDDQLPPCTDEERWATKPVWAVMEKGKRRATKLHGTQQAADIHAASLPGSVVQERPREYKRCENYCDAYSVCSQGGGKKLTIDEKLDRAGL
jgi:hypothetical protein